MNKDLITLQETLYHHEEQLARLSEELYAQQKEIHRLQQKVTDLEERLKNVGDNHENDNTPEPPPPHY